MLKEIIESCHIKPLAFNELSKPKLKGINNENGKNNHECIQKLYRIDRK